MSVLFLRQPELYHNQGINCTHKTIWLCLDSCRYQSLMSMPCKIIGAIKTEHIPLNKNNGKTPDKSDAALC